MLRRKEMRSLPVKNHRSSCWSTLLILLIASSAWVSEVSAQKRKPVKKTPVVAPLMSYQPEICIPTDSNFATVLQIDNGGKVMLTTQSSNRPTVLFDANLQSSANDILASALKPTVTIKADRSLRFEQVVKVLKAVRQVLDRCFNVEASTRSDAPYVYIYPEPRDSDNLPVYPNPLLLVTRLDNNAGLTLNNESQGSLVDTSPLRDRLGAIFKEREENGVLRPGTNRIEKEVRITAAASVKFGDVIRLVDALKDAGASPIGLQIDETDNMVEMRMEILAPPKPKKP